MRYQAIASLVFGALLAAIIAAIPAAARAEGEGGSAPAATADGAGATGPAGAAPAAAGAVTTPVPSDGPPSSPPPAPDRMVASLSHQLQFGLALLLGGGYRGTFPYHPDTPCGDAKAADNRVCTSRAPSFIDVQPSFGISRSWDVVVDVRLSLEKDFNNEHPIWIMPGFRYWMDPQSPVKFFTTMQLAYDPSSTYSAVNAPHPVSKQDLGIRNSNGLMFEVMRNFGVYAQFGETIGFVRWLTFAVDAGVGVQARVP